MVSRVTYCNAIIIIIIVIGGGLLVVHRLVVMWGGVDCAERGCSRAGDSLAGGSFGNLVDFGAVVKVCYLE